MIVLMACGSGPSRELENYYMVAFSTQEPYFQDAEAGMTAAGALLGVNVQMVGPTGYDAQAEKTELDRVIGMDPSPAGIMVSVSDADVLTPSINSAIARGINVITFDSDAPDSNRLSFVGTNNSDIGEMSAQVTAEQLGDSGGIVIFTTAGQPNLMQRVAGFREAIRGLGNFNVIQEIDTQGDPAVARSSAEELLTGSNRNRVNAIVCMQASSCPEVADVVSSNGIEGKVIIAMDAEEDTLEGIRQGVIQATVAQRPYTMGYVGMRLLGDLHHYPPRAMEAEGSLSTVPEMMDTGAVVVTAQNLSAFTSERNALAAPPAPAE